MKNNKWIIAILSVFVLMFVSCKDSLIHDFTEQKETATLSFSVNGASSRNILPDTSIDGFTDVVLTGTLNGAGPQIALGDWNSIEDMLDETLAVDIGRWNLNLTAKKGTVNFAATASVAVTAGQKSTASFVLSATNTQNGIADITLRYPKKANVVCTSWSFRRIDPSALMLNTILSGEVEGFCYIDSNYNQGEGLQEIKDDYFTLKTELPAGKYIFECNFGYQYADIQMSSQGPGAGVSPLGDYYNYIVVQPGLESKLDYTIEYFELYGLTQAVSTDHGMELTIDIPRGVRNLIIERVTDWNQVVSNPTEENMANNIISFAKMLAAPTTSSTTMTFVDPYGYTAGQELTYIVFFDYSGTPYVKTVSTAHDGIAVPGLSKYPVFETESDSDGKTTKIKLVTEPVIDWKGNELDSDYMIMLSQNYEATMMFEPDYVFTKDKRELDVDPSDLHSGPNPLDGYRLCFENDGWYYNCGVNTTGVTGAQPPVLYGKHCAIPTDHGIDIEVYCDWQGEIAEEGGEKVKLLRSTNPDSGYEIIKDFAYAPGQIFIYVDRKNLQKDVTYYYKLVGESETVYGDFSATSSINYGKLIEITTNPKLEVSDKCIATFTPGTYQVDEHVKMFYICYQFKQSDNNNVKLIIAKSKSQVEGEWIDEILSAWMEGDSSINRYPYDNNNPTNSKDLYLLAFDGKQFDFEKAYIECYDALSGASIIDVIPFTPGAQERPDSFVIHTDVIQLSADHSSNGITLNIQNIPQEADSILVTRYSESDYTDYELFRVNNLSSSRISLLDSYVNPRTYYYYTVYAYKGGVSLDYAKSVTYGFSSYNGGVGELEIYAYAPGKFVIVQFEKPSASFVPVIHREGGPKGEAIITPASGKDEIADYFVVSGWTYNYSLSTIIDYDGTGSIIYTPRSSKDSVNFNAAPSVSYDWPKITKVPAYEENSADVNDSNQTFTLTFTGSPEVYKDEDLPEFIVSKLDLNFVYDSVWNVKIPYTGSNTATYTVITPGSYDYKLQSDSYGILTCDDYTWEGYVKITDTNLPSYKFTVSGHLE